MAKNLLQMTGVIDKARRKIGATALELYDRPLTR